MRGRRDDEALPRERIRPASLLRRVVEWRWLVAPVLVGSVLRLLLLPGQVLAGDELHAVRAALSQPLRAILVTYQLTDNCIPLTALYRIMMRFGPLSETMLRAPIVMAGIALLAAIPLLVERQVGRSTARLLAWWLALSPILVLYSGVARSYMLVVLLGFAAVMAFYAWLETQSRRYGIAYVLLAGSAIYFHLGAASFVAAPLLFAASDILRRRDGAPSLAGIALLLLGLLLLTASFVVPAWASLRLVVAAKQAQGSIEPRTLSAAAALLAGTRSRLLVLAFWGLALGGIFRLRTARPRFAAYALTVVVAHLAALAVLAPYHIQRALAFDRYVMVLLPIFLLWAAVGLNGTRRPASLPRRVLPYAFLAVLVASGPLVDPTIWSSSFSHHSDFLAFFRRRRAKVPADVPAFYRSLAGDRSSAAIVEFPWQPVWSASRAFYAYQELHRHPVIVSPIEPLLADSRLGFHSMAAPRQDAFLRSGARYVVVHRNVFAEEDRIAGGRPRSDSEGRRSRWRSEARREGGALAAQLEATWGPPAFADERIAVWDLDALRAGGASATGPPSARRTALSADFTARESHRIPPRRSVTLGDFSP